MSLTSGPIPEDSTSGCVLVVHGVGKNYGSRQVLTQVEFGIPAGMTVGLVGENGSGKSTLLRILVGLLQPTSGSIAHIGRIGYCPQEAHVIDGLTMEENFRYFAAAYGLPRERWRRSADFLLKRLNFTNDRDKIVGTLSGGTRQKLNLSLALLHEPDMLVLDEPYAGFDWSTYERFWDLAGELRAAGRTILIVSHLIYDRSKFDRVFELRDGRLFNGNAA